MDWIPDEAVVIRGGRNQPADIARATATHPSGITGVSVECGVDEAVAKLAFNLPHGQIGTTTVGMVRASGGDVIRTSGRSPFHATMTGLEPSIASKLLTPTIPNPSKSKQN